MTISFLLMVFAANLGVKYMFKNQADARKRLALEQEELRQELTYLKYQLNPHFFMNTLNNIHALVDIDPDKAKLCIVEMSHMMRYMLYECNKDTVSLAHSIAMIENYIALMRIRYDDHVDIRLAVPAVIPAIEVPPLLMIPFVENAFKHGVSYAHHSFIHVSITADGTRVQLICNNSKHNDDTEHGGVGITNVVKRLQLIYGEQYSLHLDDQPDHYKVTLTVPVITNDS